MPSGPSGAAPTWGSKFRAARVKAKLTQQGLGERVGVGYRTVLRWEKDEHLPEGEARERLARLGPPFARLVSELPAEDERRYDLAQRVRELERRLAELEELAEVGTKSLENLDAAVTALLERVEQLSAQPRQQVAGSK